MFRGSLTNVVQYCSLTVSLTVSGLKLQGYILFSDHSHQSEPFLPSLDAPGCM